MHCWMYYSILCPSLSGHSLVGVHENGKWWCKGAARVWFIERCLQSLNSEWMECCRGDRHTVRPVCTLQLHNYTAEIIALLLPLWPESQCADHGVYEAIDCLHSYCLPPLRWLNLSRLTWKSTNSHLQWRSLAQSLPGVRRRGKGASVASGQNATSASQRARRDPSFSSSPRRCCLGDDGHWPERANLNAFVRKKRRQSSLTAPKKVLSARAKIYACRWLLELH